jgi:hypothetical protein
MDTQSQLSTSLESDAILEKEWQDLRDELPTLTHREMIRRERNVEAIGKEDHVGRFITKRMEAIADGRSIRFNGVVQSERQFSTTGTLFSPDQIKVIGFID